MSSCLMNVQFNTFRGAQDAPESRLFLGFLRADLVTTDGIAPGVDLVLNLRNVRCTVFFNANGTKSLSVSFPSKKWENKDGEERFTSLVRADESTYQWIVKQIAVMPEIAAAFRVIDAANSDDAPAQAPANSDIPF